MFRSSLNIGVVLKTLSILIVIVGMFMLLCLPFSSFEKDFYSILLSSVGTMLVGGTVWIFTRKQKDKNIGKQEGYIIVAFVWVIISFFGAFPFYLGGFIPEFTNAFFETISGFTTTGATILSDIEAMPRGLLFWRSLTHWIGGMGIIVLSLAILPLLGIGGMQLFIAEVPGPNPDKLHPRMTETAKRLWGIYVLLTIVETVLLMFGGMDLFDSLCHAFATMATGGFSTYNDSIAGTTPYIQYVIIFFMFFAGTNFTLHYFLLKGRVKKLWNNEEYKFYLFLLIIVSVIIAVVLIVKSNREIEEAFRGALFTVVSIVTTTGFVTDNYLEWPRYAWFLIFLMMFVGGCAGSTGGGVKIIRQLLLLKNGTLELKRLLHPKAIIPVRLNRKPVQQNIIFNVLAFVMIYMITFAIGSFVMTLFGLDFKTALGAAAASLGNIGPAIGGLGPVDNYAAISDGGKWFLSFLMLLGRLELFTVLVLFTPSFWRK